MERKLFAVTTVICLITFFGIIAGASAEKWEKIAGPWLWMIAPTAPGQGGANSIDIDSLDVVSGGTVTEADVAANGATEGDPVGNYEWKVGYIDINPPGFTDILLGAGNINKTIGQLYGKGDLDDHTSYALITVESETDQEGVIKVSSDDAIKIWINGHWVDTFQGNRSANAKEPQNAFDVTLQAGRNLLMVKVSERTRKWAMYVGLDVPNPITLEQTQRVEPLPPTVEPLPEEVHLTEISGNAYISEENREASFAVKVQDTEGNPIRGVPVKFQIQNESTLPRVTPDGVKIAVLDPEIALTDADGLAHTTLTVQPLEGTSGKIVILAYVPKDINAQFPIDVGSISNLVTFWATTEAETIDIKGPWLWMIAKGGPKVGSEGEEINIDYDLLNKQYTFDSEEYRAKHGAYKGERQGRNNTEEAIGDSIFWTPGKLNEDGNVNECLIQNRMLQGSVDHYTAYALINLFVEWKKWDGVILHLGSDDAVKVWLNGEVVHKHAELRSSDGYQDAIPVNLNLGDNLLMVKVSNHTKDWRLFVGLDVPTGADINPKLPETLSEIQIQDELPLTIVPNPPVSEVAFGKESTYFVLTIGLPEFPVYGEDALIYRYKDAIIYDDCWIRLVIEEEGISGFIFPLFEENTEESIKELVLRKSIEVVSDVTGKVAGEVAGEVGGAVVGAVTVKFIGPRGSFVLSSITADVLSSITADQVNRIVEENLTEALNPTEKDPTFQDPVFRIDVEGVSAGGWYLEYRQKYLVMVANHRLEEITMNVYQTYRFTFEETVEKTAPLHGTVHNEPLNLKDIWATENSDLGAPSKHPMALSDYPPFQQLPPEVQEYLLRHFGQSMNSTDWQIPETTSLLPNYPNPFNPETWIPYQLAEPADVTLTIYDIQGRVVRTLDFGHQRAGMYHGRSRAAHWDGRNAQGESVASGVYFYTLTAGEFTATRKMLIMK